MRKSDAGGPLNARLGKALKDKRGAGVWKDRRRLLAGLLLMVAITFAIFALFVRNT